MTEARLSSLTLGPLLLLVTACGDRAEPARDGTVVVSRTSAAEDGGRVIARTSESPITVAEIATYVGEQGLAGTPGPTLSGADRYAQLARRMVLESELLRRALAAGVDQDEAMQEVLRRKQRLVYTDHYLRDRGPLDPVTDDEVQARFEALEEQLNQPERRHVRHIFLPYASDAVDELRSRAAVQEALAGIRAEVLAGRSFAELAHERSQSESRHRDGNLGFIEPGQYPPDFDSVVFSLEPEQPSEVVSTADGAHLFYVDTILPAREVALADVRDQLLLELALERRLERVREAVESGQSQLQWLEARERVGPLLETGVERPLLQAGGRQIGSVDLREFVEPIRQLLANSADRELAPRLLEELGLRELLLQQILKGIADGASKQLENVGPREPSSYELPEAVTTKAWHQALEEHYGRQLLEERVRDDQEVLVRYHADNVMRFATPLRLRLQQLDVPSSENSVRAMVRLEQARAALDGGETTLSVLGQELGGRVTTSQLLPLLQFALIDPSVVRFGPSLDTGRHSPPYATAEGLRMFVVLERIEPEPQPLAAVREEVIEHYLQNHGVARFQELTEEILRDVGFELVG